MSQDTNQRELESLQYYGEEGAVQLGSLIRFMEGLDPGRVIHLAWCAPHSYRGYYSELGLVAVRDRMVADVLACLRSALGATYTARKGGDYTMTERSGVFVVSDMFCLGQPLTYGLLRSVFGDDSTPDPWVRT